MDIKSSESTIYKRDIIKVVGGDIRRVAIITIGYHPCACYLARKLRSSGVELFLFSQNAPSVKPNSWKYFRRLLRNRGLLIFIDNLLSFIIFILTFLIRCSFKRVKQVIYGNSNLNKNPSEQILPPALQDDQYIKEEDWISIVEVKNINSPPDQNKLRDIKPDLILLAGSPILSPATIEIAKIACLNPHEGISPMYAGNSPFVWPLYEKRFEEIGFTIHLVVPTVDGGPIIYQEKINWKDWSNRDDWNPDKLLNEIKLSVIQKKYDKMAEITLAMIAGRTFLAKRQVNVRVMPPAGYIVKKIAKLNWVKYINQIKKNS